MHEESGKITTPRYALLQSVCKHNFCSSFVNQSEYADLLSDLLSIMLQYRKSECLPLRQVDAIVFLVDAVDRERFSESKRELDGLLADEALAKASVALDY